MKSAKKSIPNAEYVLPYEEAEKMLLVGEVEDSEFLVKLISDMYAELPNPKGKKKK